MSDVSNVLDVLVALIGAAAYPAGSPAPGTPSAWGMPVSIRPGWPNAETLQCNLAAVDNSGNPKTPVCNVSVYPRPDERNTTRYSREWQTQSTNTPTLTATVSGQTVTFAGTVPNPITGNPHNVMVLANGKDYVYAVLQGATLTTIAAALAALIAVDIGGTTSSGGVITLPSGARIGAARVGVTASSIQELGRQERLFQIGIWADSPANRDALAIGVDGVLRPLSFLTMPDGFAARIIYKSSPMSDALEKTGLFRRDLLYTVEFATTQTQVSAQMIAGKVTVTEESSNTLVATDYV